MTEFEEMGFTPGILKAIQELGFEEPMPVQREVIPIMLEDTSDIIALAQTGTGKTAAFGLPLVLTTDTEMNYPQSLILCPTRELCIQIASDLEDFSRYTGKLRIVPVYGGASMENQIRGIKKGAQIIVATPGRLIDLIGRGAVKLSYVNTVILDEADEMLNMGFLDSINEILMEVPAERRTLLFSATMSKEIASITGNFMNDPVEITIGTRNSSADNVKHGYYLVHARDKYKVLKRLADSEPGIYAIVFCRTRKETQEVASKLMNDGYNADALHGDLSQAQRDSVMQKFRSGNIRMLVATDVAARGLDVDDITHVINFSLPDDMEVYTHRCGRTGRAGKNGISLSIVHLKEKQAIHRLEKFLKKSFNILRVPTGSEICHKQLFNWVKKLESESKSHCEIEKFLPEIKNRLGQLDREELLRRIVSLEFDRFLNDYRNGEDVEEVTAERASEKYSRLFINLGKSDGLLPEQLIDLVNTNTRGKKVPIGKIDLMKSFSFFEVEASYAERLLTNMNNAKYLNRKVTVEFAQERKQIDETQASFRSKKDKSSGNKSRKNRSKSRSGRYNSQKVYW